jgi:hypothetical protein
VDGILSRQGGFPSKWKGIESNVKIGKGSKKQGNCAMILLSTCTHVYNAQLNVECNVIIVPIIECS